jgi:predicted nuclease with TOPRIM domain
MAKGDQDNPSPEAARTTTLLRSLSQGIRAIVTVTERLQDLRAEAVALRGDLQRLAESVYRIAGRLEGIEQRFTEVDKRVELAVKVAVKEAIEDLNKDRKS